LVAMSSSSYVMLKESAMNKLAAKCELTSGATS
jgi:hypothetical protein